MTRVCKGGGGMTEKMREIAGVSCYSHLFIHTHNTHIYIYIHK